MNATHNNFCHVLLTAALAFVLVGCGSHTIPDGASITVQAAASAATLRGQVHGGQQPVTSASITLYAATIGSAGSSSSALTSGVTTDSNGNFTITGDYSCPTSSSQVYIVSAGGNPGLSPSTTNNAALILMAALGSCGNLTSSTNIIINEVTTVAAAYALEPYMTDQTHVSATSANSTALTSAFTLANELANVGTGVASGPSLPTSSYVPAAKLNSLANILSNCVNSNGSTTSGQPCAALFTATAVSNSSTTLTAALNVAKTPTSNVAAIYGIVPSIAPFQPTLSTQPTDWTMTVESLSWATPSTITYGTALSSTQLNAAATVPGSISYSSASGTVPHETQSLTATFTPSDTADYPVLTQSVTLTVTPTPATLALTTSAYTVNETDGSVTLNVQRSNDPNGVVTVNYATTDGTGTAGTTYTATSGTLTWADQDLAVKSITVPILNPGLSNTSQTFKVVLSSPGGEATLGTATATVTVLDGIANPAGTISWSATSFAATESTNIVTISATRSGATTGSAQVSWATSDGTATQAVDYSQSSSNFSWSSGVNGTDSVNLTIDNPGVYGGTRTFYVTLSNPIYGVSLGSPVTVPVVISDNLTNSAGAIQFTQATYNTSEGAGSITLGLTRTTGSTGAVSATITNSTGSATSGVDYTAETRTASWASGDDTSTQYVTIPILNPGIVGGTRYFYANMSVTGGAVKGSPSQAVIAISDADTAATGGELQLTAPSYAVQENAGSAKVQVSRSGGSTGAVSVNYATTAGTAVAGTDYTTTSGTLNWAANDTSSKTITIPIANQHLDGGYTRAFTVTISSPSGAVLGAQSSATVNIVENDTGDGLVSFITPSFTISENSQYIKLLVQRTTDMTGAATVNYATASGTAQANVDYTPTSGSLSWADGDNVAKIINVPILDAGVTTGASKTFTVTLSSPSGATLGTNTTSTVNVIDNDSAVNYCPTPASNPTLGTVPSTTCSGLTLAGTTAAAGYPECSGNFSISSQSGTLVTAPGTVTAQGANDFFFGQTGILYNIDIPAAANLSVSQDNGTTYPCSPDASESIGGVPLESQGNTPYYEVVGISGGSVLNYGTLNTYPLNTSTANNYKPTSAIILNLNTSSSDQVTNFGSMGDYYTTAGMTNISSGYATYNTANLNSDTLGYAQEAFAAVYMNTGVVTNAPGAYMRGDNAVFTNSTPGTFNNYGTVVANNDGYLGSWTVNNYNNAGMGLNRNAYDAAHNSGTTNNWGYMISGDFGVEMGGNSTILNTYGGPAIAGAVDFDGNQAYGGEIISIQSSTSCSVEMDSSNQQVNLISRTITGTTYLPIIVGPMCGSYLTTTPTPKLNILNFNFSGLSTSDYTTLTNAIASSLTVGPYGNYYTGSVVLQGHLYEWVGYGYVNFTGVPPS